MKLTDRVAEKFWRFYRLPHRLDAIQESLGRIESRLNQPPASHPPGDPRHYEFKVYSQWGEDGIIDHILQSIPVDRKVFVEFGVETYIEANTLFLIKHRHWSGLVIDGSAENIDSIRRGHVLWRYDLAADCSFITRDNINEIITRNGIRGDIGLLSVDIDGNDYWVWQAIDCIEPRIVICEYNSLFGPTAPISIPYAADFYRTAAHPSNLYYGASISALCHLAGQRGYSLVAGNSAGNNVFFVRNDCLGTLKPQRPEEAYVQAGFRESRTEEGRVHLLSFAERRAAIGALPATNVVSGEQAPIRDLLR
jgi:hypothetical protein